jgi:hypothetical protein
VGVLQCVVRFVPLWCVSILDNTFGLTFLG